MIFQWNKYKSQEVNNYLMWNHYDRFLMSDEICEAFWVSSVYSLEHFGILQQSQHVWTNILEKQHSTEWQSRLHWMIQLEAEEKGQKWGSYLLTMVWSSVAEHHWDTPVCLHYRTQELLGNSCAATYFNTSLPMLQHLWVFFSPDNLFGLITANKWEKRSQPSDSGQSTKCYKCWTRTKQCELWRDEIFMSNRALRSGPTLAWGTYLLNIDWHHFSLHFP